jgi:hypothetical protein
MVIHKIRGDAVCHLPQCGSHLLVGAIA